MGQKIIQGDLRIKGALIEEGISLDTKWSQLSTDVVYPVTFNQRFTISKICKRNYGREVAEWHTSDGRSSWFFLSDYNLTAENTVNDILGITSSLGEINWGYSVTANTIGYGSEGNNVESVLQTLEEDVVNIREVAEGKCKTFIVDASLTIENIKTSPVLQKVYLYNSTTKAFDIDITDAVKNGEYDSYTCANSSFNSTADNFTILSGGSSSFMSSCLILREDIYGYRFRLVISSDTSVFSAGDIILVTQTDVPDRWVGQIAGMGIPLYKLETTKVELPTVNNGKLSIQLGGTEKASFTANQSGDTTLNITKTDITNLGIPSENTWRPVQNNLTSTSTTDALSAAQGKALKDSLDSKIDESYLYHTLTNGAYYYDSYQGNRGFRIITENMLADTLRWQASTVANKEYWDYNSSSWKALDLDLSNLFDGDFNTSIAIPHDKRKFRFTITANSGWPTTALIILAGSWFDSGTVNNVTGTTYKSIMTIETRSTTSDSWATKATANFSTQFDGTCGYVNNGLHTGHTLYRITVELGSWTTTTSSASLRNICILSNYAGSSLTPLSFDGTGKVTAKNTLAATTLYENGTSLTNKYQSKFTSSNKLSTDYISGLATVATSGSYNDLTNKPTLFSGSYTDLTNKPTIPSAVTEDTVAGWGFTKNTGTSNFSGSYTDLTNKPTLFSGDYNDLSNKPALFSGDYNDLSNKPTIPTEGIINTDLVITSTNQPTWNGKELLTLDDLYRRKEHIAIPIDSVTDLNSSIYTNPGIYGGSGGSFTNCPVTGSFIMEVYSTSLPPNDAENVTWSYRFRKLTDYLGNEYIQHCHTAGTAGSWLFGDWKQIALSDHVHTGYLKGSISDGVLTITE